MSSSACVSPDASTPASQYPTASTKASQDRQVLSPSCTICKPAYPGHNVALNAGLGEKAFSQLIYCPGPLVSGCPALHNVSIRAKYILSFSFLWRHEMSRHFQNSGEVKCDIIPRRGLVLSRQSRHSGASPETVPFALSASVTQSQPASIQE